MFSASACVKRDADAAHHRVAGGSDVVVTERRRRAVGAAQAEHGDGLVVDALLERAHADAPRR